METAIRVRGTQSKDNESELFEFINKQIQKMQSYSKLGNSKDVSFLELNEAIISWDNVNYGLISLNAIAKIEHAKSKEAFDDWFAMKYIEVRNEVNPRSISNTKWYGSKEIEMEVRVRYKEDYKLKAMELEYSDQKVAFLRRMLESWDAHRWNLNNLSKNIQTEMSALGMDKGIDL